jgi:hypothetical protein
MVPADVFTTSLSSLARLEIGIFLAGHFHARAGLGVAANAGLTLPRTEAAEAANLDLVAAAKNRTMLSKIASTMTRTLCASFHDA